MEEELKGAISIVKLHISRAGNNKSKANKTSRHIPYQVLAIKEVNRFATTKLNWWLLCLKVLIKRPSMGHNGGLIALQKEQVINSIIVSVLVRLFCISISMDLLLYPFIQQREWRFRVQRLRNREVSNNNIKESSSSPI